MKVQSEELELFSLYLIDAIDEGSIRIFIGTFTSETHAVDGFIEFVKDLQKVNDANVTNWEKLELFLEKKPQTIEDIQKYWQSWFSFLIVRHKPNEIVANARDYVRYGI